MPNKNGGVTVKIGFFDLNSPKIVYRLFDELGKNGGINRIPIDRNWVQIL